MQQSILKFLLFYRTDTAQHYYARQTAVAASGFRIIRKPEAATTV